VGLSICYALGLADLVVSDITSSFFLKYGEKVVSKNKTKLATNLGLKKLDNESVIDILPAQIEDFAVGFLCGNSILTCCELDFEILQDFVETNNQTDRIPLIKEKAKVFLPEFIPKINTFEFLVETTCSFPSLNIKQYRYYQIETNDLFSLPNYLKEKNMLQAGEVFTVRASLSHLDLHIISILSESESTHLGVIKVLSGNFYAVSGSKQEIQDLLQTKILSYPDLKSYIYPLPETTYVDFIQTNIGFVLGELDFGLPKHSFRKNQDMYLCKNKFIAVLNDKFWVSEVDFLSIPFFGVVTNMINSWWLSQTRHMIKNNLLTNLSSNILVFDTKKPLDCSIKIVQIEDGIRLENIKIIHQNLDTKIIPIIEYQITNLFNFCQQVANSKNIFIGSTEIQIAIDGEAITIIDTLLCPSQTQYFYLENGEYRELNQKFWNIWQTNSYHKHPAQAKFSKEIISLLSLEFIDFYEKLTSNQFDFPIINTDIRQPQMSAIENFLLYDKEDTDIRLPPHKLGL
jgi:hypothetical protein